jgi:hypothetical protein
MGRRYKAVKGKWIGFAGGLKERSKIPPGLMVPRASGVL